MKTVAYSTSSRYMPSEQDQFLALQTSAVPQTSRAHQRRRLQTTRPCQVFTTWAARLVYEPQNFQLWPEG